MNRFKEIIDELSQRRSDVLAKDLLPEAASEDEKTAKKGEPRLRLPYASDPEPLEQPWAN